MPKLNFARHAIVAACLICVDRAVTGDAGLTTRTRSCPEYGTKSTNQVLRTGGVEIEFAAPRGWTLRLDAAKDTVVLRAPTASTQMMLRYLPADETAPGQRSALAAASQVSRENDVKPEEKLRQVARQRFPEGRVLEEFVCVSGNALGQGIDLVFSADGGLTRYVRMGWLPFAEGAIHVELMSSEPIAAQRHHFASLLGSLRLSRFPATATL